MGQGNREGYSIYPIEKDVMTEQEMLQKGIMYFNELTMVEDALNKLGVLTVDYDEDLYSHGFILSLVGPTGRGHWVLYSKDLSYDYVKDLYYGDNFYEMSKKTDKGQLLIFTSAYIRKSHFDEDVEYYINLDLMTSNGGQYGTHPNYLH